MAKIAFVQHNLYEGIGAMSISSLVKKHGHYADVFCRAEEEDFYARLADFKPDVVACGIYMGEQGELLKILTEVKKNNESIVTLIGGPFTMVFPEIINEKCVDLMCIGDGEFACLEILNRIDAKKDFFDIPGVWMKKDGIVHKSHKIAYAGDIKQLPSYDWNLYYGKYPKLANLKTKSFVLSRGCPFQCAYCYTYSINKAYNSGELVHFRLGSPEKIIEGILYVKKKYGLKWVRFQDATFNANLKFAKDFLRIYAGKNLPGFIVYARAENVDEEFVSLLKKAGCDKIVLGIQTGNEEIRKRLANRYMSNEQIIDACNLFTKYKIRIGVDVMFGWPGETIENAYETVDLCGKINPADINSNVLVPYFGTKVYDYCLENRYIDGGVTYKEAGSVRETNTSLIRQDNIKQLINLEKLCWVAARFPRWRWLIELLIKLPPNRMFIVIKDIPSVRRHLKYEIINNKEKAIFMARYLKNILIGKN